MRRPLVAGNWKMNGTRALAGALAAGAAAARAAHDDVDVLLCPPATLLALVAGAVGDGGVAVGAQDCSEHASGAYTGETAAAMIRETGATHAIVGHSERRQMFGDTDARVALKASRAVADGLVPVICVGEMLEERRAGQTEAVVRRQLEAVAALDDADEVLGACVIAYEPVWAIGTGESATPEQAQAVHAFIRSWLDGAAAGLGERVRILYGGSVKPDNAGALLAMPDIDGGLVGGASLDADSFAAICAAASGNGRPQA